MDILKIEKSKLKQILDNLQQKHAVFFPIESKGITSFNEITLNSQLSTLNFYNTDNPPKEIFFPQSEAILKYNGKSVESGAYKGKPIAIFGVRPCDAKSFTLLNKVFDNEKYTDIYWRERYKEVIIFTIACNTPLSTCFCHWVGGSPFDKEGTDVFLVDIDDAFLVEPCSDKGEKAIHELSLHKATVEDLRQVEGIKNKAETMLAKSVELASLKEALDKALDIRLWEELAYRCLGCAACTYLCPTCYCFDIQDEALRSKVGVGGSRLETPMESSGLLSEEGVPAKGERIRIWDSCMFKLFTQEAAGTNPRPTLKERFRQRIMHKFNYLIENVGKFGCVGCGRCIMSCPVNIDIREVIKKVI